MFIISIGQGKSMYITHCLQNVHSFSMIKLPYFTTIDFALNTHFTIWVRAVNAIGAGPHISITDKLS